VLFAVLKEASSLLKPENDAGIIYPANLKDSDLWEINVL